MAKTGHPNFVLQYSTPWRGITKGWSFTSNHSGATLSTSQALTFLQAVDAIVKAFISGAASQVFLERYAYYDGQNSAPTIEADFSDAADGVAAGFTAVADYGSAYETSTAGGVCGGETCVVLIAPVGESKTNKPIVLRHWIHNVPASSTDTDVPPLAAGAAALAAQLGDGTLPGNRVLCSATGKQGTWTVDGFYGAHKMSRKWKKSTAAGLNAFIENQIENRIETSLKNLVP